PCGPLDDAGAAPGQSRVHTQHAHALRLRLEQVFGEYGAGRPGRGTDAPTPPKPLANRAESGESPAGCAQGTMGSSHRPLPKMVTAGSLERKPPGRLLSVTAALAAVDVALGTR